MINFNSQELRVSKNFLHLMLKVKLWVLKHFGVTSRQTISASNTHPALNKHPRVEFTEI